MKHEGITLSFVHSLNKMKFFTGDFGEIKFRPQSHELSNYKVKANNYALLQ
jgi:hypothetical protein